MPFEYAPFGDRILGREEGSTDNWIDCTDDVHAQVAVEVAAAEREQNTRYNNLRDALDEIDGIVRVGLSGSQGAPSGGP